MFKLTELLDLTSSFSVLYVEDDEEVAATVIIYLEKLFHKVGFSKNGEDGLDLYSKERFDIVITDIQMPKMDGLEMSKKIKEINPEQNIIVISAYADNEKFTESIKIGIDGYILKPVDYDNLNSTLFKVVNKIKKFNEHAEYERNLEQLATRKVKENTKLQLEKIDNYEQTLFALINMIENRDIYTGKHSLRVANYSKLIAQKLGYSSAECDEIYKAGILHDIGKVAIPDTLLLKPGTLTNEEYDLIKEHVNIGFHMLNQIPMLKKIARIINGHHEKLDGSGYPFGLKKDEISIESNILAVADAFDAMTTNRIYKGKRTVKEAINEIELLSGIHYIKEVAEASKEVLIEIVLDDDINQIPATNLEKARFSYYYNDNMTGLYNNVYLNYILADNQIKINYEIINIISINKFSEYNIKYGWLKGNDLLIFISKKLSLIYKDFDLFRIHHHHFIILSAHKDLLDKNELEKSDDILQGIDDSLSFHIKSFHIFDNVINSDYDLEKYL